MARYDTDGFYVQEQHVARVAWTGGRNYSLALTGLLPADSGTWVCTVNARTQYLHATALLIRGASFCIGVFVKCMYLSVPASEK